MRRPRRPAEPVAERCERELCACIDRASRLLEPQRLDDEPVHEVRKELKKARASLRLLRYGIDGLSYKQQNSALRYAARPLAALRDARALSDALQKLLVQHPKAGRSAGLDRLKRTLRAERTRIRRALARSPVELERALTLLAEARLRAGNLDTSAVDGPVVTEGLKQVYRKGRKGLRRARSAPTVEALHEWRKQVKYLLNQLEVCFPSESHQASGLKERAEGVADRLGEDHDLAMLERKLAGDSAGLLGRKANESVLAVIGRERKRLQKAALKRGAGLFAARPKVFASRIAATLRATAEPVAVQGDARESV